MSASDESKGLWLSPTRSVRRIMAMVLLALVPGIVVSVVFSGIGTLVQITIALAFALVLEAAMLKMRARRMALFLTDLSAPLTAVLFALLIPPTAPWWIAAIGVTVAIVFAKHLYGGLGRNLFNPAMAGLVVVAVFFPREFNLMLAPSVPASVNDIAGHGREWLALAYTLGGLLLLWKKIIPWQTPVATLTVAFLSAMVFRLLEPNGASTLSHSMFPAVWLLGAFFIVTDPVTGCISAHGRLLFGAGVGALGMLIGHWRGDAFGLACAVLLMNCLAPWVDRHASACIPRQVPGNMGSNA